jgi:hypothetical protein
VAGRRWRSNLLMDDFVRTIDSDAEIVSDDEFPQEKRKNTGKQRSDKATALNPEFIFDLTGDTYQDVVNEHAALEDVIKTGSKPVSLVVLSLPGKINSLKSSNPSQSMTLLPVASSRTIQHRAKESANLMTRVKVVATTTPRVATASQGRKTVKKAR